MLDINWLEEAEGVINDIKSFVRDVHLSKLQPNTQQAVLLNLETYEGNKFCIQLCKSGFGIVGRAYDTISQSEAEKWYETPYAMLSELSESYVQRFNQSLYAKLMNLREVNEQ